MAADSEPANNTARFATSFWLDAVGDGLGNLEEYRVGTDPGDAGSYLWINSLVVDHSSRRVELRWGSAPNRLYPVLRSAATPAGFEPVAERLPATPRENVWYGEPGTDARQQFYRLKVEQASSPPAQR